MRILTISILAVCSFIVRGHEIRMAHYFIHVEDEKVMCDAKIDLEDLRSILGADISHQAVSDFFSAHFSIHFDGKEVFTEVLALDTTEDWVEIKLELKTANTSPSHIEVFNNILSNEIDKHDNLMRFILHGRKRIFRLNKDRQEISFSYKES